LIEALRGSLEPLFDARFEAFQGADAVDCTFFGSTPYAMAEKMGIPFFQVNFSPIDPTGLYSIPIMRRLPFGPAMNKAFYHLAYRMIGGIERRYAHPLCERNGLAKRPSGPKPDYRIGNRGVSVLYAFSEQVAPRAPEWGKAIRQIGFFHEEVENFAPSAELRTFLEKDDPPLYIGFGSMTSGNAEKTLRPVLDALERARLRAVLTPGWSRMDAPAFPENIHCTKEYVPHGWLFPRVCAAVHHGGAGTTASSLRAGAPTLVVPFGGDQFFWGERVHALGCGPKPLSRAGLTGRTLANRLQMLVSTAAYRRNAARIGEKLRGENGILQAVEAIEQSLESEQEKQ
jgi:UDP:flavonoid glycosyltransferase YjiC (YdhE family)